MRARVVLILTVLGLAMAVTAAPVAAGAPVVIVKTDTPDPVVAGGILTYTIVIQNPEPDPEPFIMVRDFAPEWITFQSASATAGTVSTPPGEVQWILAPLAANASETLIITSVVDPATPAGTLITNAATAVHPFFGSFTTFASTTVAGAPTPTPTPAASLVNAATAPPATGSPLAALGFAALLLGALGVLVVANARGVARRR